MSHPWSSGLRITGATQDIYCPLSRELDSPFDTANEAEESETTLISTSSLVTGQDDN